MWLKLFLLPSICISLTSKFEEAIAEFVKLCPGCAVPPHVMFRMPALKESSNVDPQHRLSQKLKERLGYLGVYYKRDTAFFLPSYVRRR